MLVPTYLVVPPLFAAFGVLVFLFWRSSAQSTLLDLRFLMMAAAILLMFAQIVLASSYHIVSQICFALALVWLAAALLLLRRYLLQG